MLDKTPERLVACQREIDRQAGQLDQKTLDYERREGHHLRLLEIKDQEIRALEQTLKHRYTLVTVVIGIAAAGVTGYAVGRIHAVRN